MKAFHGSEEVKADFLGRIKAHRDAERLLQGYGYWQEGKGCAVGCTVECDDAPHESYPGELGLPVWLAHLEDHIFEALPAAESQKWPEQFLGAIGAGAEVPDSLRDRFQMFWLERQRMQIDQNKYPEVDRAIVGVISLLRDAVRGEEPEAAAWSAAEAAARSAAEAAAWSAAEAAAEAAARSAAEAAAWSAAEAAAEAAARSAAWSAAWSAARSAARSAAWSAAWSAARSAAEAAAWPEARSAAWSEAIVKRDWLLAELKSLETNAER